MADNSQLVLDLQKMRRWAIVGLFLLIVAFVLFEALRGHHFWSKVKGEGNLWNYGSSLVLVLASELAILNAVIVGYQRRSQGHGWLIPSATWAVTGAGFLFLACDEMLSIHEKLGARLGGGGSSEHSDGMVFAVFVGIGLLFGMLMLWHLLPDRTSRRYFALALFAVLFTGLLDVMPRELYISHLPFRETEELAELLAGWSFVAAFLTSAVTGISQALQACGTQILVAAEALAKGGKH